MSIITKITQPGNRVISTLDGKVRLEEGRNRIVASDSATGGDLNVLDSEGLKTFNPSSNKEIVRNGRMPDDSYNAAFAPQGGDIKDAFS